MIALPGAPFPVTYRELWLPPSINGNATLPTSAEGGHGLALTGARKGTTVDGVHGNGAVTSNINCGANAIDNASAKYWVSLRFRLDQDWTTGDGDQYLWGKFIDATHYIRLKLNSATGALVFEKIEVAAGFTMSIASPAGDGIWHAGVWYQTLCSISDTAGARFKVNDANLQTDVDVSAMPNGGDLCFLDFDDPGAGTGFEGVEVDIFCGNDNLSGTEETELYKGFPPADTIHIYLLDEGRGLGAGIAIDRGLGADNGALDTSCEWAFGQVQQPVLSLDSINDFGQSSAGVDISGDLTLVWVGKMKSSYNALAGAHIPLVIFIDAGNYLEFVYFNTDDVLEFTTVTGGVVTRSQYAGKPAIDDYMIFIGTLTIGGVQKFFVNGTLIETDTGVPAFPGAAATAYLGTYPGPLFLGISKPLIADLIDGAFTDKQVLAYSRWLRNVFNLPIAI